jgi:hypothetical protein
MSVFWGREEASGRWMRCRSARETASCRLPMTTSDIQRFSRRCQASLPSDVLWARRDCRAGRPISLAFTVFDAINTIPALISQGGQLSFCVTPGRRTGRARPGEGFKHLRPGGCRSDRCENPSPPSPVTLLLIVLGPSEGGMGSDLTLNDSAVRRPNTTPAAHTEYLVPRPGLQERDIPAC